MIVLEMILFWDSLLMNPETHQLIYIYYSS